MITQSWRTLLARLWHEDEGLLTFEYTMLATTLVLGTMGAVSGIRDSINAEATGLSQNIRSLDQMRPALPGTQGSGLANGPNGVAQPSGHGDLVPLVGNSFGAAASNTSGTALSNSANLNGTHYNRYRR